MKKKVDRKEVIERGLLSFQHMFAMLGATIIVPILANMSVAIALLSAGIGTILCHLVTKRKVPVFLGSSFAYLASLITIMGDAGVIGSGEWNERMGGLVVAIWCNGLIYVCLSFICRFVGVVKVKKLFPPHVVGPVVIVLGMILAPKILYNNIILPANGSMAPWKAWSTALITLATILVVATFSKPKSFMKVAPILIGFIVGYVYALRIGIIDYRGAFSSQRIVIFQQLPQLFGFYRHIHFEWSYIALMAPIAIVTFMEHLGDISANSTICQKDFMLDPGVHNTILGDSSAIFAAGVLGGPPQTTYGENTAILAITKNYDSRNLFNAALLAVLFGIVTVFSDFITTIPAPVVGGASIALFGMISASGLRALIDNKVDLGETRALLIVSVVLALGLGFGALSLAGDILNNNGLNGDALKVMIGDTEVSSLALCTIIGIVLNLVLPKEKVH